MDQISRLIVLILFLFSTFTIINGASLATNELPKPRKLIIDTDAGGDDAVAILLALKYEARHNDKMKIIAITCVHGNTNEKNVEQNVLKTLTVANRNDIPVYGGAEKALTGNYKGHPFFGNDGFGDFQFTEKFITEVDTSKKAAVALVDLVKANPGEITIVALGCLTNIALATRLDSTFMENIGELIIMGSSVAAHGMEMPNVEFNFAHDPESNFIVLNSTKKPCTLFPWETAMEFGSDKTWRRDVFGTVNSSWVSFLNRVEGISSGKESKWISCDTMTLATLLWPETIKNSTLVNVTPVFDGAAKGSVLVDYYGISGKPKNVKIIQSFDTEFYNKKVFEYFSK